MSIGDSDPLIWTPSAVKGELSRIRGVIDTINMEMSAAVKAGKLSGDEWQAWFDGVYTPTHQLVDSSSSLWGSNVNSARGKEQAALKWRALVQSRGAPSIGPKDLGRKPDPPPPYLGMAGIAVAGIVLYLLLKPKL